MYCVWNNYVDNCFGLYWNFGKSNRIGRTHMEEFLLEHGGLIISGIIAIATLIIMAMVIWMIGRMELVSVGQTLGVCL